MEVSEFHTVRVDDGTALHAAWAQLYRRCAEVIGFARGRKSVGQGVWARPESDMALLAILGVMESIDPTVGWLERGLLTYAYTLDDALRRAPEIHWRRDCLEPIRSGEHYEFKYLNADALLRPPAAVEFQTTRIAGILAGALPIAPLQPLGKSSVAQRRLLYDVLLRRSEAVRAFLPRPDGSRPKACPVHLDPIPSELGEPLWRNESWPTFAGKSASQRRRFADSLLWALMWASTSAHKALQCTPSYFGLQNPDLYKLADFKTYDPPRLHMWLGGSPLGLNYSDLVVPAMFDRVLGGPPEPLLSGMLCLSRYAACDTRWSLPRAPRWLHIGLWDTALLSCGANDESSLGIWCEHYRIAARHFPPSSRACCRVIEAWVRTRRWPSDLKLPKAMDRFEAAFLRAMRGLCEGNAAECAGGVSEMLVAYPKIDYRLARGREWPFLCLQAVALQRMARREGLVLNVPDIPPNDQGLVEAPDPARAEAPWCTLPGIELVCNSYQSLQWPALYLNQPVREVIDPPLE